MDFKLIASGWSPVGWNGAFSLKSIGGFVNRFPKKIGK